MNPPDIAPRKPPRQKRAAAMVDFILEAATRVLAIDGLSGLTTNRVAEVAGVGIGSLYQYFPNKSALVAALIVRTQDRLAADVEQLAHGAEDRPIDALLHDLAALAVQQQYAEPLLAAALDAEETRLPVQPLVAAAQKRLHAAVVAVAERCRHPQPDVAARDLLLIAKVLVEADVGNSAGPAPDLAARLHRALAGYLVPR
jgi:AcrR family transcriptional regulator